MHNVAWFHLHGWDLSVWLSYSVVAEGILAAREGKPLCASAFQASACVLFIINPLAKGNHLPSSSFKGWRSRLRLLMAEEAKSVMFHIGNFKQISSYYCSNLAQEVKAIATGISIIKGSENRLCKTWGEECLMCSWDSREISV